MYEGETTIVQTHDDGTGVCEKCNKQFRRLVSGSLAPHFDVENQRDCPGGFIPKSEPHSTVGFKRIPGSRFAICGGCHEEHLLTKTDVMSIHNNSAGQRCEGSATPEQIYEMAFIKLLEAQGGPAELLTILDHGGEQAHLPGHRHA